MSNGTATGALSTFFGLFEDVGQSGSEGFKTITSVISVAHTKAMDWDHSTKLQSMTNRRLSVKEAKVYAKTKEANLTVRVNELKSASAEFAKAYDDCSEDWDKFFDNI